MLNNLKYIFIIISLVSISFGRVKVRHTNHSFAKFIKKPRSKIKKADSFECLNGKNPANLTKKEVLIEFSKGKCSPVLLAPGVMATKLVVVIKSCQKLRQDFPELFSYCGFTKCSNDESGECGTIPLNEYAIWIPELSSPMSVLTWKETTNFCWAKFLKQKVDFSKPIEESIIENDAFKIHLYGNTEKTKNDLGCGDSATQNLLPFTKHLQIKATQGFYRMHEMMKSLGYVAGLTYQTIPYNFLKPFECNEFNKNFLDNLKRLNKLTNKKVVLMGHSLGNMNILFQLNKIEALEKDKLVKLWIAVGPPFLGSIKANKDLISGNDELIFLKNYIGLRVRPSIDGMNNIFVIYNLRARDPFWLYRNEAWFQPIKNRTLYEAGKINYEQSGFKFLPSISETCSPKQFNTFVHNCVTGLYDTNSEETFKIMDEVFRLNETEKLYQKWNTTVNTTKFIEKTNNKEFLKLTNPQVPFVLVSLRTLPTARSFVYKTNVTKFIENGMFYYPDTKNFYGDGTVPSYSSLIPPLKWAWEYDNKAAQGAKPVKIVDLCSLYKQKNSVFDDKNEKGEFKITNNEFFGLNCDCMNKNVPSECAHSAMTNDSGFLTLFSNAIMPNEFGLTDEHRIFVDSLSDDYLKEITIECNQIKF